MTPVAHLVTGQEVSADFEPSIAATGQALKSYYLKKLLTEQGWRFPEKSEEKPDGPGWCEAGGIDTEGHERGWKLAKHLDGVLTEIADRVERLIRSGFAAVRVVTDHGWLLMPGGLPKTELASSLSENTWGRCAALKPGAVTDEQLYPWFWNPHQEFALADGISCYRAGVEYTHGGLSVQECVVLQLTVTAEPGSGDAAAITDVLWKGLRCRVTVAVAASGLTLDLRKQAGSAASSIVQGGRPIQENGTASFVVEDEDEQGNAATLVLLDAAGCLVAQRVTVVGKETD